jgi:RNA polymerase sigma factor (sigma-70 family)
MADARLGGVLRQARPRDGELQPTDAELLRRFAAGRDGDAFAALVRRHGPMVFGVCRHVLHHRQDAEDAFQAVFLVLARNAASVRKAASAAAWLHGVAYRTACCARRAAARRRKHEGRVERMPPKSVVAELTWREVRTALDEEVARLPAAQRSAFVLCCLEGRSQAEASRQLGVKEGTVSSRLDAARKRLRGRLARRGVGLAAVLAAAALAGDAAAAPPVDGTVKAALSFAAGSAGAASANVAALVKGATRALILSKTKTAAVLLTLGLLAAGAGALAQQAAAPKGASVPAAPPPADAPVKAAIDDGPARADAHGDPLPDDARLRLGTGRLRQVGRITKIAFGPDGKTLLSGSDNHHGFADSYRCVQLWDAATGKPLRPFSRDDQLGNLLRTVAYSPDGKTVAAGFSAAAGENGAVVLWDAETGKKIREIVVEGTDVQALCFSADGKAVFTGSWNPKPIRCFDAETGKERWSKPGHGRWTFALAASPDGKLLASVGGDDKGYEVALWDAASGERLHLMPAHKSMIYDVEFSADGKALVTAGGDGTACVWDAESGKRLQEVRHPKGEELRTAALSPDGRTVATAGTARVVRLWDMETGKEAGRFEGARETIRSVAFTPDGKTLAAADGSAVLFWDVKTGKEVFPSEGHQGELRAVAFSPAAPLLATAGDDRVIVLWDAATGKEVRRLDGHGFWVSALAFSPDGKLLASGGNNDDAAVRLWDVASGKELARFEGHKYVGALAFAPDGKTLASADLVDASVRVWQAVGPDGAVSGGGKPLKEFKVHDKRASGLAFSPGGKRLATADDPGGFGPPKPNPIRLWDLSTGKEVRQLEGHAAGQLRGLAFSPDGRLLASAGNGWGDQSVRLWDVETGKEVRRFESSGPMSLDVLAFSPDGKALAGAAFTGEEVRLWEVATGAERRRFTGHAGVVEGLAFSADGRTLASVSDDTTALLWDVAGAADKRPAALTAAERDALWGDLSEADAAKAYRAMRTLTASGGGVALLRERLKPAEAADAKWLARLLADLDADDFETRAKAVRELEELGEAAEPALRRALEDKPSVEVQQRAEKLLARLEASPERLRSSRATEVLEWDGGAEAKKLLSELADGAAGAFLTRQATATLERMQARGR